MTKVKAARILRHPEKAEGRLEGRTRGDAIAFPEAKGGGL